MRVYAVSGLNNRASVTQKRKLSQEGNDLPNANAFKGAKGAIRGAKAAVAYTLGIAAMTGPFACVVLPIMPFAVGTGALAGHCIEEEWNNDNDNNNNGPDN